jgi:hypothetical protein
MQDPELYPLDDLWVVLSEFDTSDDLMDMDPVIMSVYVDYVIIPSINRIVPGVPCVPLMYLLRAITRTDLVGLRRQYVGILHMLCSKLVSLEYERDALPLFIRCWESNRDVIDILLRYNVRVNMNDLGKAWMVYALVYATDDTSNASNAGDEDPYSSLVWVLELCLTKGKLCERTLKTLVRFSLYALGEELVDCIRLLLDYGAPLPSANVPVWMINYRRRLVRHHQEAIRGMFVGSLGSVQYDSNLEDEVMRFL